MRVLGIETSCDETAVAVYDSDRGVVAHHVFSQLETHRPYGGVVPELASRDHIKKLLPLVIASLKDGGLAGQALDGIAYTSGPGLIGALMVGSGLAKSLGYAWGVPTLGVHHMESHLSAALMDEPIPDFPFVALLVSGGHSQLIEVQDFGVYRLLGDTRDDAAGEAFDKLAKLLGLGLPGGPRIAKLAEQGDPTRFTFPRPMSQQPNCDFSFSGLKTHAAQCFEAHKSEGDQVKADIACAFEAAIVDSLCLKSTRALEAAGLERLVVVGGVSANTRLRQTLCHTLGSGNVYFPRLEYCTDNGAMVAFAGYQHVKRGHRDTDLGIHPKARWPLVDT